MIRSMEVFTFVSALELNMGYYHIKLDSDVQKLCTIVFPLNVVNYKYKLLPMSIKIAIFVMFLIMPCLSLSKIWNMYLDDLLILTNGSGSLLHLRSDEPQPGLL
jgi:hypothetical protein